MDMTFWQLPAETTLAQLDHGEAAHIDVPEPNALLEGGQAF
jgi:hypothetical protein